MKTYFCLIRKLQPSLSDVGNQVLLRYYQMQRQSDCRNAARTTIRLLESLIRLAEAHARLMFRDTVTLEDAITVVSVMESSMQGGALLGGVNALHTSFPENPREQYQRQCELILEKLELQSLLGEELRRLERLQNQNVHPSQPQAVESAEASPGSSGNDSGEQSQFRTSTPQELTCGMHTSSPGGIPKGSLLPDPPSQPGPSTSTSRKHSAEHKSGRDDSLGWFDFKETPQIEPKDSVLCPGPKTSGKDMVLKISNSKLQGKDKSAPSQRRKLEARQLSSPGETDTPLRSGKVEGKKAKTVALVSAAALPADEPDSVPTHHVPSELHRRHKKRTQEFCRSTARVPSMPTASHSPERTSETPKRKRPKSHVEAEEPELESVESPSAPLTKLAKFTFKQKSKLTHSPEDHSHVSTGTTKIAVHSPTVSQHRTKKAAALPAQAPEMLASTSGTRSSAQLRGKARGQPRQPPEKDESKEKREYVPEESVILPEPGPGGDSGRSPRMHERGKQEEVSGNSKSNKVHSGTLAKLANFCFTSPSESKSESPPPPERKNWGESHPSAPATTATALGSNRKSFQLRGSTEKLILAPNPLFTLPELDDEALDFDWDEEMRKKPCL